MPRKLLTLVLVLTGCATSGHGPEPAAATDDTMARFRGLEGTWTASFEGEDMPSSEVTYRTIAGGSAVVETIFAGMPHEMITVIHLDGDRMLCTHYCAAQNQPHLVANEISGNTVRFVTDHVTNLASPGALYMGEARWEFVDDDHIRTQWTSFENGERGETMNVAAVRVAEN